MDSDEYDWRRRLSRKNTTGGALAKYGLWRRLRGGGSGDYGGYTSEHIREGAQVFAK